MGLELDTRTTHSYLLIATFFLVTSILVTARFFYALFAGEDYKYLPEWFITSAMVGAGAAILALLALRIFER